MHSYFLVFGGITDVNIFGLVKVVAQGKTEFQKIEEKKKPPIDGMSAKFNPINLAGVFNEKETRVGETPSANCHGTARGLAKLAAIMANKGQAIPDESKDEDENVRLMTEETWRKMHDGEKVAVDAELPGGINGKCILDTH